MTFKIDKMFRLPDAGTLKAFCDVSCDDVLVIKGVRIMEGKKGLFVGLPREQGKDNKWYDQIVLKDADTYDRLSECAMRHYKGHAEGRNEV